MKKILRPFAFLFAVALAITALGAFSVSAGEVYTSTVSFLNVRENASGEGVKWDNRNSTLTLENFKVDTTDRYGLRIPDGATVIIKGTNEISASYAALDIEGSAYFKGEGTLILNGGEIGFLNPINLAEKKVIIESGTYIINSEGVGVQSNSATWSQTGGKIEINCKGDAVVGRDIRFTGGNFTANGSLVATSKIAVSHANLTVKSEKAALISDRAIALNGVRIESAGKVVEEYNGENEINIVALSRERTTSMLFGKNVGIFADYLVLILSALIVAAIIVVPIIVKKKRFAAAVAKYNAEKDAE